MPQVIGFAPPGAHVTVTLLRMKGRRGNIVQRVAATATRSEGGVFRARLGAVPAEGPYVMVANCPTCAWPRTLMVDDVLVGDVWLVGMAHRAHPVHGGARSESSFYWCCYHFCCYHV